MKGKMVTLGCEQIYPHPENPRKELGDISELVESIKKNGIMQNLTVIPGHWLTAEEWSDDGYTLIIGHRRHAAAVKAGLQELPCKVVEGLSRKEQIGIMLEENMQRNDLTIYEQAQGFQLMLDLGETEETIAQKTGFSRSTVRHRLNIAKLDPEILKKKEHSDSFQLSLKDLYALEQVKDINERNKILQNARDSKDLVWRAQSTARAMERKESSEKIIELLKESGVKKAPKKAESERYSGKWDIVKEFKLETDVPNQIKLPKGELYYLVTEYWISVIKKAKKKVHVLTPEEKKRERIKENIKEIEARLKVMDEQRKEFIQNIISGKIAPISTKEEPKVKDAIWNVLLAERAYLGESRFVKFFTGKEDYRCTEEEKTEAMKKTETLSVLQQMLIIMHEAIQNRDITNYNGMYSVENGNLLLAAYKVLEIYGWSFLDEESEQIVNGTHELYTRKEE